MTSVVFQVPRSLAIPHELPRVLQNDTRGHRVCHRPGHSDSQSHMPFSSSFRFPDVLYYTNPASVTPTATFVNFYNKQVPPAISFVNYCNKQVPPPTAFVRYLFEPYLSRLAAGELLVRFADPKWLIHRHGTLTYEHSGPAETIRHARCVRGFVTSTSVVCLNPSST